MNDEVLTNRAKRGDRTAMVEIYQRHYEPVYRYIYFRVGDQMLAEELAGDVFVRVVEKINQFSYEGRPVLAWLYTIARNLVIDYRRKHSRTTLLSLEERDLPPADHQPSRTVEQNLAEEALLTAIEALTEDQRQVILLKFIEQRSNEETAAILGKPIGAVKSLQHRALVSLRRLLEKEHIAYVEI